MKRLIKLFAAGLFLCAPLQAIINEIKIYYNAMTKQWLITCSDFHLLEKTIKEKSTPNTGNSSGLRSSDYPIKIVSNKPISSTTLQSATLQQQRDLCSWANKLFNTRFMVESWDQLPECPTEIGLTHDSFVWQTYSENKELFKISPYTTRWLTTLRGFSALCKEQGIATYNLDFRYYTDFKNGEIHNAAKVAFITMIRGWENDPPFLIKEYAHLMGEFVKRIKTDPHFADWALFDANWLHRLYWLTQGMPAHHTVIISLCGGAHHEAIEPLLPKLGFIKQALHFGASAKKNGIVHVLNINEIFPQIQKMIMARGGEVSLSSSSSSSSTPPRIQSKL